VAGVLNVADRLVVQPRMEFHDAPGH
jgi:hypothetical protein